MEFQMLLETVRKIQSELIKEIVLYEESDFQSEDIRSLLNALFEIGDFVWKCDAGEKYDWDMARQQSNVETIKKICDFVVDEKVDLTYSAIRHASQLPQRYTSAIEDAKRYLAGDGLFEAIKGGWANMVNDL
jgi:hypothetical protein